MKSMKVLDRSKAPLWFCALPSACLSWNRLGCGCNHWKLLRFLRSNAMGACGIALDWALLVSCVFPATWQQWSASSGHLYFPSASGSQVAPRVSHWLWFSLLVRWRTPTPLMTCRCVLPSSVSGRHRKVFWNLVAAVPSPSNPKSFCGRRKLRDCHCSSRLLSFVSCRGNFTRYSHCCQVPPKNAPLNDAEGGKGRHRFTVAGTAAGDIPTLPTPGEDMTNALQARSPKAAKCVAFFLPIGILLQGVGACRLLTSNLQWGVLSVASLCSCSIWLLSSFLCVNSLPENELLERFCDVYRERSKQYAQRSHNRNVASWTACLKRSFEFQSNQDPWTSRFERSIGACSPSPLIQILLQHCKQVTHVTVFESERVQECMRCGLSLRWNLCLQAVQYWML